MKGIQHRTVVACLWVALAITTLTACAGETLESVKEEAAISKACTDAGGHIYYYGMASERIGCSFQEVNP